MSKPWLMGIDLGGSGARCVLVNRSSGALVSATGSWAFAPAEGTFGTGYDVDLDLVWDVVGQACRDAAEKAGLAAGELSGIAVRSGIRNDSHLAETQPDMMVDSRADIDLQALTPLGRR